MNILLYIPCTTQEFGGIRQYATGLINILVHDTNNHYFIYHNSDDNEITKFRNKAENFTFISDIDVVEPQYIRRLQKAKRIANIFLNRVWPKNAFNFLSIIDKLCIKYKIDVIHCPYQFIPTTKNAKLISTMHDVQELYFPEYFAPEERAYRATYYLDYIKRSDKIVVSYQHVKNDLIKFFHVSEDKVHVILLDMHKLWFEKFKESDVVSLKTFNLPNKFILYPANTWKHKNHLRLIEAVKFIRDVHKETISIVCTGHQNEHYITIIEKIKELGMQNQIFFLGSVNEQELFSLYRSCLGVVIPTTYEAGSFPLMESMILKVPVICSNVTSLPGTIGNDKFLFDPFSIEEIASKILELWNCNEFRQSSIQNSIAKSTLLRNIKALDKFQELYSNLS